MICSTSFSSKSRIIAGALALLLLSGCATTAGREEVPLEFHSLVSQEIGRSPSGLPITRWTAVASGGSGERHYEFRTSKGSAEIIEQEGTSAQWDWMPGKPGIFRVKVTVTDGAGLRVDSGWSSEIGAGSRIGKDSLIAVLPVENLSGARAPLEAISRLMRSKLSERGLRLVDPEILEDFMARYRIRDTGGLHASLSRAISEETGAEAYLVTSLEAYRDVNGPIVSMLSRLVLSGEHSEILWMDGVGLAGNAFPGILRLGIIEDLDQLVETAARCLADSLSRQLGVAGEEAKTAAQRNEQFGCDARGRLVSLPAERCGRRIHRPRSLFRGPGISADRRYRVALIPFLNLSNRNNAGKLIALHFANQLNRTETFSVVEPGLVREQLLRYRIIMQAGPSLANADLISAEDSLGVDLVFSGTAFDYQDALGTSRVDFSLKIIDARSRKIVWSSKSHNAGTDGVFFFDFGKIHTAHQLASEMTWATLDALAGGPSSPDLPRADPREARHHSRSSTIGTE